MSYIRTQKINQQGQILVLNLRNTTPNKPFQNTVWEIEVYGVKDKSSDQR